MNVEQGFFSIIRWCPDTIRDECKNLGVLLIDAEGKRGAIRVVSPSSMPEAIARQGIVPTWLNGLKKRFEGEAPPNLNELADLSRKMAVGLVVTEPKALAVVNGDWDAALVSLWKAYAMPTGRPMVQQPVQLLEKKLRKWIMRGDVVREYGIEAGSGLMRTVDFFLNSGRDTALDTVRLNLSKAEEIIKRADAEANKIRDIKEKSASIRFVVYCDTSPLPAFADATGAASRILKTVDAQVFTDLDQAARVIEMAAAGAR